MLPRSPEYTLIAILILLSVAIRLGSFLGESSTATMWRSGPWKPPLRKSFFLSKRAGAPGTGPGQMMLEESDS